MLKIWLVENSTLLKGDMKYLDIRASIKSGDILAFSHGDWKTWRGIKTEAVRIFTRSTYSHVAIAWVVANRVFIIEPVVPKTRIYPLSTSGSFYHLPLGQVWTDEVEEFALSCVGIDYSQLDAIRAYLQPLEDGNVSECAAYVREVYKRLKIDLGDRSTPDAVVLKAQILGAITTYVENGNNNE